METFWEKIQFWKRWIKPKTPKEGVDYEFYHIENSDLTGIKLLKGDYRGITYYYGTVKLIEQGALANLKFEFKVLDSGTHDEEALQTDEKFVTILGDILTELIISESAKNEQTRNEHPEEFDIL
jgi:hypothetical protein